jgi:hypothetical protein
MKVAINGGAKHPDNCSDKDCICGCHSASDVKKNKNHNSTKQKLNHRKESKFVSNIKQK